MFGTRAEDVIASDDTCPAVVFPVPVLAVELMLVLLEVLLLVLVLVLRH